MLNNTMEFGYFVDDLIATLPLCSALKSPDEEFGNYMGGKF
jgi:hypothetical protein